MAAALALPDRRAGIRSRGVSQRRRGAIHGVERTRKLTRPRAERRPDGAGSLGSMQADGPSGPGDGYQQPLSEETYDLLTRMAERELKRRGGEAQAISASSLVHEAYGRLDKGDETWGSRSHFCAVAGVAMGQIFIDRIRKRDAVKRGGDRERVFIEIDHLHRDPRLIDSLLLAETLERLGQFDKHQLELVLLKVFSGLTMREIADALGCSKSKAEDEWRHARAWLRSELSPNASTGPDDSPS